MLSERVINQLKDNCDCLPKMTENEFIANVDQMIYIISLMTCWVKDKCDTFLNSPRKETLDLSCIEPCNCDGTILDFKPFYRPFQPETFEVYVVTMNGLHETVEKIPEDKIFYSDFFQKLRIDLNGYAEICDMDICGCPGEQKLVVNYDAGYEQLPDCLIPVFCRVLSTFAEANDCECETCTTCQIDSKDIVEVKEVTGFDKQDWASLSFDRFTKKLLSTAFRKQLGLISLCPGRRNIWGLIA